jgi:rhodanese-related sulfurtransferase
MAHHAFNDEGFLAHANATAPIQQAHIGSLVPRASRTRVEGLLDSDCAFVDARYRSDFEAGHLPGAINIPVNTCRKVRREAMAHTAKYACIVVYCQSADCKFAEEVTAGLVADGFSNVSIFKGGWNEWTAKSDK